METVYPVLPSTTCSKPAPVPAFDGATPQARETAFTQWLSGATGRKWLADRLGGGVDCYDKLMAVHAEQLNWPAGTELSNDKKN